MLRRLKPLLIISLLLAAIVPLTLFAYITLDRTEQIASTGITNELNEKSYLVAQHIEQGIQRHIDLTITLARYLDTHASDLQAQHFTPLYQSQAEEVYAAFQLNSQNELQPIYQASSASRKPQTLPLSALQPQIIALQKKRSLSQAPYFSQFVQLQGHAYQLVIAPFSNSPHELVILFDLTDVTQTLNAFSQRIKGSEGTFLINLEGEVITYSEHRMQSESLFEHLQGSQKALLNLINQQHYGHLEIGHDHGKSHIIAFAYPDLSRKQSEPWALIAFAPTQAILQPVSEMQQFYYRFGLLTLLLCSLFALLLARRMSRPLTQLTDQAKRFQVGDYHAHPPMLEIEEFGILRQALNQSGGVIQREQQDLLAQKIRAESADRAKSAFLATLSHEIRTPMNGVLGLAQLLLKTPLNESQTHHLVQLYDSGNHMMTLLNDILDFSKIEQGKMQLDPTHFLFHDIIGSVESTYHSLCKEKGIELLIDNQISPQQWFLADKARIRQILFNLLNNAVKFTNEGRIDVHIGHSNNDPQQIEIRVKDTGIGIAPERIKQIFEPFTQAEVSTTRQFGGSGLGLAIVRQLCQMMQGDIDVESILGIGTQFRVTLRVDKGQAQQKRDANSHSKLDCRGLKVLIVEDNKLNTMIIDAFLKQRGFETSCVEDGQQALDMLAIQDFDLILMDNHMPIMDGKVATRRIRQLEAPQKSDVVILACTADAFEETKNAMLEAGVDHVLTKPLDERKLDDALAMFRHRLNRLERIESTPTAPQGKNMNSTEQATKDLTQQAHEVPPLDFDQLMDRFDQDEEIINACLAIFIEESELMVKQLKQAQQCEDLGDIALICHSFKGSAANLAAEPVRALSEALERSAKAKRMPSEDDFERYYQAIEQLCQFALQRCQIES
ncbi:Sensor histidine kinase RcsC [Vibrio stylophorae]|uniref:histidine kinase n=1 Tax=Vibrio stylophorae TaxID=659351 RepID=A0ABM8ZX24_9VIBR|nr:ATP-binding protein [Vibrio stylophorae]CAH0535184.1 Sensor histidine kinase RcsC [Vibrio stylophorae]